MSESDPREHLQVVDLGADSSDAALAAFPSEDELDEPMPQPHRSSSRDLAVAPIASQVTRGPEASQAASSGVVPIARIIEGDAAFEWHDAVAIVMQLVEQLIPPPHRNPAGGLPVSEWIWLNPDGSLVARLVPHALVSPVVSIGQLLGHLLSGRAQPVQLRLIVMQASDPASSMSLPELLAAIARWERPNRLEKLKALAERGRHLPTKAVPEPAPQIEAPIEMSASRAVEPQEAASAVSGAYHSPVPPAPNTWSAMAPKRARVAALVAGCVVAIVAIGAFAMSWAAPSTPPPLSAHALKTPLAYMPDVVPGLQRDATPLHTGAPTALAEAQRRVTGPPRERSAGAWNALEQNPATRQFAGGGSSVQTAVRPQTSMRAASQTPTLPMVDRAEQEFRRAKVLFDAKQYPAAIAAFEQVAKMLEQDEKGESSSLRWAASEYAKLGRATAAHETDVSSRLYKAGDQHVTEPVPLGPFLPGPPSRSTPPERLAGLDIVIDARGQVESVRLTNQQGGFRDRWWLPAAKAWRFEPATKDGVPVRFLKHIEIPREEAIPR